MDSLLDAMVMLRDTRGRFTGGLPLKAILRAMHEEPAIIDLPAFVAAIGSEVQRIVSTSVAAAFAREDDRRVDLSQQQLINECVALAAPDSTWARTEARSLMKQALRNLTRCRMRLQQAAAAATPVLHAANFSGQEPADEVAAHGLMTASLDLSVGTILQAVFIFRHVEASATANVGLAPSVVKAELGMALDALQELMQTVTGVHDERLMPYSPLFTLHHASQSSSVTVRESVPLAVEIKFWLDIMALPPSVLDGCDSLNLRRGPVNHARIAHTAILCWTVQCLLEWFTSEEVRLRPPELLTQKGE